MFVLININTCEPLLILMIMAHKSRQLSFLIPLFNMTWRGRKLYDQSLSSLSFSLTPLAPTPSTLWPESLLYSAVSSNSSSSYSYNSFTSRASNRYPKFTHYFPMCLPSRKRHNYTIWTWFSWFTKFIRFSTYSQYQIFLTRGNSFKTVTSCSVDSMGLVLFRKLGIITLVVWGTSSSFFISTE